MDTLQHALTHPHSSLYPATVFPNHSVDILNIYLIALYTTDYKMCVCFLSASANLASRLCFEYLKVIIVLHNLCTIDFLLYYFYKTVFLSNE